MVEGRRLVGAVAGGLAAGLGIAALLMLGERKSGTPSELADLERRSAAKLWIATLPADQLPSAREQAVIQGGHLALSAAAAATAYAAATDEDAGVLASGVGFGLAFYAVAHWITGLLLGVKQPEWRSGASTIGMHMMNHVLFGLATAAGARAAARA